MQTRDHQSGVSDFTLERRLDEARPSGGVRPCNPAARPQRVRTGLGPFLVKGSRGLAKVAAQPSFEDALLRAAKRHIRPLAQVIPIPIPNPMATPLAGRREYRFLVAMALIGPLVWLGHAVLVWLRLL